MKHRNILLAAALALPLAAAGQSIQFDTQDYKSVGVYDSWTESPFRKGTNPLEGNVKVIDNHLTQVDDILQVAPNPSAKIVGFQRSRFGSNLFGLRVDLQEPLTVFGTTKKYVHVLINKPLEGRVMLVGLGKRTERADQSPEAEQFWVYNTSTIVVDKWCDAVFPVRIAEGIEIHSLVIVPDCESPHNLKADFAAYIDDILVNDKPTPRFIHGDYPVNFEKSQISGKSGNYLNHITLNGSSDGNQTLTVGSRTPQVIYREMLDGGFSAKPGEVLTPGFSFTGSWMNGYVYLDRGRDGRFDARLNADYTIAPGSDVMTYAYVETVENTEGYNSRGEKLTGQNRNILNPPAFTLPADLEPGYYRMRFKVDWGDINPGGRMTATNDIISNGGMIVDTRINVHGDTVNVARVGGLNGDLMLEDGVTELTTVRHAFGRPFTIVAKPAPHFTLSHVVVRRGYNLSGDSLLRGTAQYVDEVLPGFLFKNNRFTLPAEMMKGDVRLLPEFVNPGSATQEDDYAVCFDKENTIVSRTDRRLASFKMTSAKGGAVSISVPAAAKQVYRDLTAKQMSVVPGDAVSTTLTYTGNSMHAYLYVDFDQNGRFSPLLAADGRPSAAGELISYTYYQGKNSLGESPSSSVSPGTLPVFTLPEMLPVGVYRARLKVDWNNIDPLGQWTEGGNNNIDDNGGYVIDFLLNVHNEKHPVVVNTVDGSINGYGTAGLPHEIAPFTAMTLTATPAAEGYVADKIVIRHGHNLDGEQYIRGNRQWSEYERPYAATFTLPRDSVNGDLRITARFERTDAAKYHLVFSDEFDAVDGTLPDTAVWKRCTRQSPVWKRWLSVDEQEHRLTAYIENGQLVTRALPNPFTATDNVPMITGGVESRGAFGFKYGKIEGRLRTEGHTGNFPAFWMMPDNQREGWPDCGEIDIWEQINSEGTSYHTVHSNWTYDLGHKTDPKSSFAQACTLGTYHTFGFEWDEAVMRWYLDGKEVGSYAKSTDESKLAQGQWPFDRSFYIILNQSVGNGSWAANADVNHTYTTYFDWVRVYQKDGQHNTVSIGTSPETSGFSVSPFRGGLHLSSAQPVAMSVTDLGGRRLYAATIYGTHRVSLESGVYIVAGRKVLVP